MKTAFLLSEMCLTVRQDFENYTQPVDVIITISATRINNCMNEKNLSFQLDHTGSQIVLGCEYHNGFLVVLFCHILLTDSFCSSSLTGRY